ncbi:MAG: bacillithiol biosynthesis cysteine-adding enzyme BshC [bacterium]|nr:bacillithiol biosynthesis cysteine-adding enzyme BshC [bacterium]
MELYSNWPLRRAESVYPYYKALLEPPEALRELAPPSMSRLDDAIAARRRYADASIDRAALADGLSESMRRRRAPASALEAVDRLREPGVMLVIAGQQPGAMGGPLLTVYKAAQAIALARRWTNEGRGVFLPAFWTASEDHDFEEIASIHWLSKDRAPVTYTWPREHDRQPLYTIPAADFPLGDLTGSLDQSTHPSEWKAPLLETIRECASSAAPYPDAFDALLWTLFADEGLLIFRPEDGFMRRAAVPIMRRELREPSAASREVEAAAERVREAGLEPQLHKAEDRTSFFLIRDSRRLAVYFREGRFETGDGAVEAETMMNLLEQTPGAFSPSAILRPVVQDAILPVAASVLGPGETAYHFLLDGLYRRHGVERPALAPRTGLTLIESRDRRAIEKYNLAFDDLGRDPAALLKRIVGERGAAPDAEPLRAALRQWAESLRAAANEADPTIVKPLEKNIGKIEKEIENSENLLLRRQADKESQAREQIEAVQAALAPEHSPQERCHGVVTLFLKYGPAMFGELVSLLETLPAGAHACVLVP